MSSDGGLGGLLGNLFGGKDGGGIGKVLQDLLGGKMPDATGASDKVNIPTPDNPAGPIQPPGGHPGAVQAGPQPGQVRTGPRAGIPTPGATQPQPGGRQPGMPAGRPGPPQGVQYSQPQDMPQAGQAGVQPPQAPRPQAPQMPQAPQAPQMPQAPQGGMAAPAGAAAGGAAAGGAAAATGLDSLLERLRKAGLGDQVTSWLSDGPNKTINPQQVSQVVGPQQLSSLAKTAGVSTDEVAQGLAKALPQVVNEMTPHGQIPDASQVQNTINRLFG